MRITFILPNLNLSGGNRVVATYAGRLRDRGHDVAVIAGCHKRQSIIQKFRAVIQGREWSNESDDAQPYFEDVGIQAKVVPTVGPLTDVHIPKADVVIATWWETAEWVAALAPDKGAKAYLVQHHEVFEYLPVDRSKATYRLPLKKLVISKWLLELMANNYSDTSCHLIPNSVDTKLFFAPPRQKQPIPTVGFLYSTVEFKSPGTLIETLRRLEARVPKIKAVAFGAEKVSSAYPLPHWVDFHYRPPQEAIRDLYSRCDVWLCASRSEGFHLPPLEAMACRCPVVSTRVGGPLDTIQDGLNGFLVDVGDVSGLATRVSEVLALTEDKWSEMAAAAEKTARDYTWDDAADRFEQALETICSDMTVS